jgi:hypothetical protein
MRAYGIFASASSYASLNVRRDAIDKESEKKDRANTREPRRSTCRNEITENSSEVLGGRMISQQNAQKKGGSHGAHL